MDNLKTVDKLEHLIRSGYYDNMSRMDISSVESDKSIEWSKKKGSNINKDSKTFHDSIQKKIKKDVIDVFMNETKLDKEIVETVYKFACEQCGINNTLEVIYNMESLLVLAKRLNEIEK